MMPTPIPASGLLAVAATGVAVGLINALSGGGSLLSFPLLTALGLPALIANATNTVALLPGYLGAALAQRRDLAGQRRRALLLLPLASAGGLLGGALLLVSGEELFRALVPWLILLGSALLALQPALRAWFGGRQGAPGASHPLAWSLAPLLLASIYGGYFGAGIGILMIAMLGLLGLGDIHRLNAVKNSLATIINGIATAVFVAGSFLGSHDVAWPHAAVMAVAGMAGSLAASRLAGKLPAATLRRIVAIIGFALAGYYFVRQWQA